MTIKKAIYETSMASLLESLSSIEGTNDFLKVLFAYRRELKNADQLSTDQAQALDDAHQLLAEEKIKVVEWLGIAAWQAIVPSSEGSEVQRAKHIAQALGGDSIAMRNAYILDNAPALLKLPDGIERHFSKGKLALGKRKSASASGNGSDRPSLRSIPAGSNFWYKYSSIWYQIIGTGNGVRLFNLSTRVEVTDLNDLPANASACQKLICIGDDGKTWADAFRGYISSCPDDVKALAENEL